MITEVSKPSTIRPNGTTFFLSGTAESPPIPPYVGLPSLLHTSLCGTAESPPIPPGDKPVLSKSKEAVAGWMKCYFTSTETVGLLGTGAQDVHLVLHTQLRSSGRKQSVSNWVSAPSQTSYYHQEVKASGFVR